MDGKTVEQIFDYGSARVFTAMTRSAAELVLTILSSQPDAGILSFNTGRSMKSWTGQDLSSTAISVAENITKIVVGGSLAVRGSGPMQLGSWGEKANLSKKFLDRGRIVLPDTPEPPALRTAGEMSVADELQKLVALRDSGALTEEEFQHQKTRLLEGDQRRLLGLTIRRLRPPQQRLVGSFLEQS